MFTYAGPGRCGIKIRFVLLVLRANSAVFSPSTWGATFTFLSTLPGFLFRLKFSILQSDFTLGESRLAKAEVTFFVLFVLGGLNGGGGDSAEPRLVPTEPRAITLTFKYVITPRPARKITIIF